MAKDYNNISSTKSLLTWITAASGTQIGGRPDNQDAVKMADTPFGFLVTVCDGMGGGPGGATASAIASTEIVNGVIEGNPEESRKNIVIKAIRRANEAIIQRGQNEPALQGMGSTCTVVLLNEESAIVAHVGDSRVYQLRGGKKHFRTFDHSMVFGLVKQGIITEEQARLSAQSNIINRALGIKLDLEVECEELPFERGDRFVLTTDGVHGTMPEPDLIKMVWQQQKPLKDIIVVVTDRVEELGNIGGGHHDNNTIAIIDITKDSKLKEKMSRKMRQLFIGILILLGISIVLNIVLLVANPLSSSEPEAVTVEKVAPAQAKKVKEATDRLKKGADTSDADAQSLDDPASHAAQMAIESDNNRFNALLKGLSEREGDKKINDKDIEAFKKEVESSAQAGTRYQKAKEILKTKSALWKIGNAEYKSLLRQAES